MLKDHGKRDAGAPHFVMSLLSRIAIWGLMSGTFAEEKVLGLRQERMLEWGQSRTARLKEKSAPGWVRFEFISRVLVGLAGGIPGG